MSHHYDHIIVAPLTPAIGAVVDGVDLARPLAPAVLDEIQHAFHERLVLFFRDQSLAPEQLVRFARNFGDIGYYPFVEGMAGHPEVVEVVKKEDETINFGGLWHTDTAYLERPPAGSVLYAVTVPPYGGDTLFANMYLAYDSLSDGMKRLLEGLRGVNSAEKPDAAVTRVHRMADKPRDASAIVTTAAHPLVRTHPVTGRKALYCSDAHTTHIEGMSVAESRPLLQYLYRVQQREEFGCRLHWTPGTVALWDNRCAQHNALNDYHGHLRVMHRVTLAGEVPC
ncbi:MAG: TauD/TfdA family dioxygenase [Gammaproteobacteria bacterium]|nr:TauD/TfdA family dioxygenase [Gammaproteobacteria bacterium]MCP5198791.1 TauD/TfdA family dioxygenase [Gammaproteobacteria bacterium]